LDGRGRSKKKDLASEPPMKLAGKLRKKIVPWHDFHATILYLMGIDHEKLTFLSQWNSAQTD